MTARDQEVPFCPFHFFLRPLSSQTLHRDRLSTSEAALAHVSMEFSMGKGVGEGL